MLSCHDGSFQTYHLIFEIRSACDQLRDFQIKDVTKSVCTTFERLSTELILDYVIIRAFISQIVRYYSVSCSYNNKEFMCAIQLKVNRGGSRGVSLVSRSYSGFPNN